MDTQRGPCRPLVTLRGEQMIETHNDNEDNSTENDHKPKGTQNKELLKVLQALESQGFRSIDNLEN
jgi:hypothetical protein